MTTFTLDFSTAYRGITDFDTHPILIRDPFGWAGKGEPEKAVTLTYTDGSVVHFPAVDGTKGVPKFLVDHSPHSNQFDLVNLANETVLSFDIPVKGAPIWENYIDPAYTGDAQIAVYDAKYDAYFAALDVWVGYVMTHAFTASAATFRDVGGTLGQFTSSAPILIDEYMTAPDFFAVNIIGSAFADIFSGGELNDVLEGGAGADVIQAQGGDDVVDGGAGGDNLAGLAGADTMSGGPGADLLLGGDGNDLLFGDEGSDALHGDAGSDALNGGAGNDVLQGGVGEDTLGGGNGSDLIYGDEGNDRLTGGSENDTVNGGAGNDTLTGDTGDDALSGGDGNDSLTGGDGADFLRGGVGKDVLTGGAGADSFLFNALGAANVDRITDFVHLTDKIWLASATFPGVHAAVDPQEFVLGTASQDGDDRILYDQASGRLWYDPDGNLNGTASAAPILFAIVANHALLTAGDFFVGG